MFQEPHGADHGDDHEEEEHGDKHKDDTDHTKVRNSTDLHTKLLKILAKQLKYK